MTTRFVLILALSAAFSSSLLALVRTPEEQQEHLNQIIKLNAEANRLPKEERIRRLGHALRQLSQPSIFYHHKEKMRSLYLETQDILLNTPGHAHYFRDQILEAKNKAFTNGQPEKNPEYPQYLRERGKAFLVFPHLPSLETMEVLSEFLDDRDLPRKRPVTSLGYFTPLSSKAVEYLPQVIQENPPHDYNMTWREWRDEVRAGHLTFRFKGSDIRYNFDGPVPDKQPRPPKPLPSGSGSDTSSSKSGNSSTDSEETSASSRNAIIAWATLFLLLALAWWGYTKRKI